MIVRQAAPSPIVALFAFDVLHPNGRKHHRVPLGRARRGCKMRNHNPLVQMSGAPERLKEVGY